MGEGANQIYVLKPGDHQAGVDGDSIKAGLLNGVQFIVLFGALTGNAILKIFSGATEGVKTTALTFRHRVASAAQGLADSDKFGSWTTGVTSLTLTAATYQNKLLVVEADSAGGTVDQNWLTLELGSEASALNVAIGALVDRRYKTADGTPTVVK